MTKPGDFFVGIVDLFAVILPGGVLTVGLYAGIDSRYLDIGDLSGSQRWILFLFCSYLFGHIVFMVGSQIDEIYDVHRRRCNGRERKAAVKNQTAYECATRVKAELLAPEEAGSVDTFKWSLSILTTLFPEAIVEINRLVADSKFFRSMIPVLPVVSLVFLHERMYPLGVIAMLLIVPCYLSYFDRRMKSTTRAYEYIIALHGVGRLGSTVTAK